MATGDQADMVARLRAVLPASWFPQPQASGASATPVLDAILNGAGAAGAWLYALIQNAVAQARISTASGVFLDGIAADFFGSNLQRHVAEGDPAFRARIKATLLLPLGTRAGMTQALQILTGRTPRIVEPWNTGDAGGWNEGVLAYGAAGCYGSLLLPAQVFVTAYRPDGSGIAQVAGYYGSGNVTGPGGYGAGAIEYGSAAMIEGQVTDAAIYATVNNARAAGVVAWVAISN
jgi:hypothetical protein